MKINKMDYIRGILSGYDICCIEFYTIMASNFVDDLIDYNVGPHWKKDLTQHVLCPSCKLKEIDNYYKCRCCNWVQYKTRKCNLCGKLGNMSNSTFERK